MSISAASNRGMEVEQNTDSNSFTYVYRVVGLFQDQLKPFPYTFTYVGLAVRILQILGFVLNPLYTYNFMFMKQMAYFIFIFSGPFFDRHYGPISLLTNTLIVIALFLFLIVCGAFFIVNCAKPAWQEHTYILKYIRVVMESIAGWLFIPMMHLCLGGLPCSGGVVRNFPDTKCGSPIHIVSYIFSILGILISVALAAVGCLIFNADPHSSHILARAHGYVDFFYLVLTIVALIFFHILLGAGHDTSFSIMMMCVTGIWLLLMVILVPYYNLNVLSLYTGTFLTTFVVAFVNCLTAYNVSFLSAGTPVLQCTIVFSIIPVAFIVGFLLGPIRVNNDFTSKLHKLHFYGYTPEHVAIFPFPRTFKTHNRTAPPSMLAVHHDMKCEIGIEEQDDSEDDEGNQNGSVNRHRFEFFVPYISNAYFSTDSELATRFLREYRIKTGGVKKYTSSQLLYTLNMYFKALGYFKQSSYVLVSMGWFLLSYCNRQAAVLELVNHIHARTNFNADYMVGFKFFRLEYTVKESLGYRGTIYILALQRAHLFHRQALGTMVRFWTGLEKGDSIIQLLSTADELARLRRTAFHEYHLALTTNKDDRNALTYLAAFIEDLLHQKDIAEGLRSAISEMELDKKNKALLAAHSTQSMSSDKTEIQFRAIRNACEKDQTIRLTRHGNERCFFFTLLYYAVFGCLGLLTGLLAYFIISVRYASRSASGVSDIFRVKASGYSAMYNSEAIALYYIENDCSDSSNGCVSDLEFVQLLQEISSSEQSMRVHQNKVTIGSDRINYRSQAFDFAAKGLLPLRFYTVGNSVFQGLFVTQDSKYVSIYAKLSSVLDSVSTPQVEWLAAPTVSAYITTLVNSIQKSLSYSHYMQFVTDGGLDVYLSAAVPFSTALMHDVSDSARTVCVVLSVLLFICLFHLCGVLLAHYAITAWSTKNRIMLINLFKKVPQAAVEDLRASHSLVLSSFHVSGDTVKRDDEFTDEDEEGEEDEQQNSEKMKANMNAFRSALLTVLQSKPGKSCIKQVTTTYGPKHTVRFCLTQYDLVEHPRRKLTEPEFQMKGSKSTIIEDFEKSLEEIEEEVKKERFMEQQRRDTYTEHLVTSGYRYQWRRIKERIASWGNNDALPLYIGSGVISFITLALAVVAMSLLITTLSTAGDALEYEQSSITQLKLVYEYVSSFDVSDIQASVFCNFFYDDYANKFTNYAFINEGYLSLATSLETVYNSDLLEFIPYSENLYSAVLRPTLANMIYVVLAARAGYGLDQFDLPKYTYLNNFGWGSQESDVVYLSRTYPQAFDVPDEYVIPSLDSDTLSNDPTVFFNQILFLHRRTRFFDDISSIREALSYAGEKIKETSLTNVHKRNNTAKNYLLITIICMSITVAVTIAGVVLSVVKKFGRFPTIYLSVALACSVACLALNIVEYRIQGDGTNYIIKVQTVLESISQFRTNFYRRVVETEQYFHSSEPTYLKSIRQYRPDLIEPYLSSTTIEFPEMASAVEAIKNWDKMYWQIQQVSLFLLYASSLKQADPGAAIDALYPPSPPFLSTYNYKTEPNYAADTAKFGSDHPDLMYSTPDVDLTKTATELFDMTRFAVFGLRGAYYFFNTFDQVEDLIENVVSESLKKLDSIDKKEKMINIIALIFVVVCVAAILAAVLTPVVRFLRSLAEGPDAELVREAMKISNGVKMSHAILLVIIATILIVVLFVLSIVPATGFNQLATVAQNSGMRLASIQRSMAKVLYIKHALSCNSACLAMTASVTLQPDISSLSSAREYLYFSASSSKGGFGTVKTFSKGQRSLLFASTNSNDASTLDNKYKSWISQLTNFVNFQPLTEVTTPDPNTKMKDRFMVKPDQVVLVSQWVDSMKANYSTLITALESSDDLYVSDIKKAANIAMAPAIAFYVVIALMLVICAFTVVPNLAMQDRQSEEDIRPILGAIPKPVIDSVPTLSLFADSGIIDESSEQIKNSYVLSDNARQFLDVWKGLDESDLENGYAELENNANPCVLSTETGIIVAANAAALTLFKHDSLTGKDIGILMDQGAAEMHSRMMAYYVQNRANREQGPAKVDVQAYTKNMETVHVVIVLAEALLKNERLYFLAEIYPFSQAKIAVK